MRIRFDLATLLCGLVLLGSVCADGDETVSCTSHITELQNLRAACQKQAADLQQQIATLKTDASASSSVKQELSAALAKVDSLQAKLTALEAELTTTKSKAATSDALQSKLTALEAELTNTKSKAAGTDALQTKLASLETVLTSTQSKLASTETQLSSKSTELGSAQSQLKRTESQLAAAQQELTAAKAEAEKGSTCHVKLDKVESKVSEQAARLAELKALEDALLPLWLSRRVDSAVAFTSAQWQQLQQSDIGAQVASKVGPHWEQVLEVTKPAREVAAEQVAKAQDLLSKLPVQETITAAKAHVANVERELLAVVQNTVTSQPALSSFNDPVTLQLVVYSIMGLPMLVLALLLVSLFGGAGRSSGVEGASGKAGSRKVAASAAGKGAKAGAAKGAKAATVSATPSGKKGKAVKDGSDVLYTP